MLLSIFSSLYEFLIGVNGDNPEYRDGIFDSVGLITFIIAACVCFIFYVVLGRWKNIWKSGAQWLITIVLVAGGCFAFAFSQAKGELGGVADSYLIRFAIFNAVYAAVYFIVLSFLFKNFSIYAKRTPF